jgi:hypothetical protein
VPWTRSFDTYEERGDRETLDKINIYVYDKREVFNAAMLGT